MSSRLNHGNNEGAPHPDARRYVGRFVRRQDNFGTILVVGRLGNDIDVIEDAKRQFPTDGCVEFHGAINAGLASGDWVEFEVVRNSRPRAPAHKAVHLRRLPHYAVLPATTPAGYRALLTKTGWRDSRREGLWALRISDDKVIVAELAVGSDGGLCIPRDATRNVTWYTFSENFVAKIPFESRNEDVFIGNLDAPDGSFDWSDDVDHVVRVIQSLADAKDPFVDEIISWLELHQEGSIGSFSGEAVDHEAAEMALRSGELAARLRADRELMAAYVEAALKDDNVRSAVAEWAREGHGLESDRLRLELANELEQEREAALSLITVEVEGKRSEAFAKAEADAKEYAESQRSQADAQLRSAEERHAERIQALETEFSERNEELEKQTAGITSELERVQSEVEATLGRLEQLRAENLDAETRLLKAETAVDRMISLGERLRSQEEAAPPRGVVQNGVVSAFQDLSLASPAKKGELISSHVLLTDHGKQLLRQITVLMLAGELPVLIGSDAPSIILIVEALLCPGRSALIEADATMISVEDLLARPGSGIPTALAAAAGAAKAGGAAFVAIRGIERSGARIWHPALSAALRSGTLPRGLLVLCTADGRGHEEIEALPKYTHILQVEGALTDISYLSGPSLLSAPTLAFEALEVGKVKNDLSAAPRLLAALGFKPPLHLSLRLARLYMEAIELLDDEDLAQDLVRTIANRIAGDAGLLL